jgi:hypothetical protein
MTIKAKHFREIAGVEPKTALAFKITSLGGLAVVFDSFAKIDLWHTSLAEAVKNVAEQRVKWEAPPVNGPLRSALSVPVVEPQTALIFILDEKLNAVFSSALPPIFVGDARSEDGMCNAQTWCDGETSDGPRIATVITNLEKVGGHGDIRFNLALDNVGVLGKEPYRTPIIIDPDMPWPPTIPG